MKNKTNSKISKMVAFAYLTIVKALIYTWNMKFMPTIKLFNIFKNITYNTKRFSTRTTRFNVAIWLKKFFYMCSVVVNVYLNFEFFFQSKSHKNDRQRLRSCNHLFVNDDQLFLILISNSWNFYFCKMHIHIFCNCVSFIGWVVSIVYGLLRSLWKIFWKKATKFLYVKMSNKQVFLKCRYVILKEHA